MRCATTHCSSPAPPTPAAAATAAAMEVIVANLSSPKRHKWLQVRCRHNLTNTSYTLQTQGRTFRRQNRRAAAVRTSVAAEESGTFHCWKPRESTATAATITQPDESTPVWCGC